MPDIWITAGAAITSLGHDLDSTWSAMLAGCTAGRWADLRTQTGRTVRVPVAPVDAPWLASVPLEASGIRSQRLTHHIARQALCDARLEPGNQAVVAFGSSKPIVDEAFLGRLLRLGGEPLLAAGEPSGPGDNPVRSRSIWDVLGLQHGAQAVREVFGSSGPVLSAVSACSTGLHAIIGTARWLEEHPETSLAAAGAVESSLCPLLAASFLRMGVLVDHVDDPALTCRPFDAARCGFVLGEGAGMVVLETAEHAARRGVRPLATIAGYARGTDPTGLADMDRQGRPLAGVIRRCLRAAGVEVGQVAAIKAHGTGTGPNDLAESAAIRQVFGQACPPVVSFKGHLGHCLGASGAVEAALCVRAVAEDRLPATANLVSPDPMCNLNHVRGPGAVFRDGADCILCLSAGFGGHLAAVLLRRPSPG